MFPVKSYEPEKICLIFEKGVKIPKMSVILIEKHTIRFSVSENHTVDVSKSYIQKRGILHFLPEARSRIPGFLLFLISFSLGVIVSNQLP